MKVAIVHDWLTGMRGGEKCLEVFCELFPKADLFTLLHIPGSVSETIERMNIRTSFIQRLPAAPSKYRNYLPLFPTAVESFDLRDYDLVLSSSHCAAKGVIPPPRAVHICYCYTPVRYAWDQYHTYFPRGRRGLAGRFLIPAFMNYIRLWDVSSSARVDRFVAISRHVSRRIELYYRRESDVIYPPVDVEAFSPGGEPGETYLVVSALVPYKRVDLAVEAFNKLGRPLVVIGSGPEERRLRGGARENVTFLGWQAPDALAEHYRRCRAFIFPGEEDFGITPLEAQASGRPVIAYAAGGALETVVGLGAEPPGRRATGLFFAEQTADSLAEAVQRFEAEAASISPPDEIRGQAMGFSRERFRKEMEEYIEGVLSKKPGSGQGPG
jgi:glycosyltransferase involved in cell wall biosynthesis